MLRKSFYLFILTSIALVFPSCLGLFFPVHNHLWFYTYSSGEMPDGYSLTPASFLYLDPAKTYTLDFGKFQYGKWKKKGDTLILHEDDGVDQRYLVKYPQNNEMKLDLPNGVVSDFSGSPASFDSPAENPFSFENNQWRIIAKHKESPLEIKERLVNHCAFWKAYFSWALNNHIDYVDVRSTPTPIKIYSNGFVLKEYEDLSATWKNYFYDSTDCQLANKMIAHIFTTQNIAWAQTDSKYKMFMGAFEQLERLLKEEEANSKLPGN